MTTPDTAAIRAQMEPLDGFTPGPWLPHNQPGDWGLWGAHRIHVADASPYDWDQCIAQVEYQTPYCLGEKRSVIEAAKTAACNARLIAAAPEMRETILTLCADVERLRRMLDLRGTGPAERYWEGRWRDEAADNERLRNFIEDFSETKFDRIDRRSPDPQDDLDPLTDYLTIEAWQEDARAALAQNEGK